jgi:hypothetical protein
MESLSLLLAASDQGSLPHIKSQKTKSSENKSSLGHCSSPIWVIIRVKVRVRVRIEDRFRGYD